MAEPGVRDRAALVHDLRRTVRGVVLGADLRAYSSDFGGLTERRPAAVVRPADARDVAGVVTYAARHGVAISPRGAGHSQGGQSLSDAGLLLDLRSLDDQAPVDPGTRSLEVGAGAVWKDVLARTLDHGLAPPVLTNNLHATIGGTHATGGIGASSFRYGSQAESCRSLEVVTGEGVIVRCSPSVERELFQHALCGLGQLAVLTRVELGLRPCSPAVRTDVFLYDDLAGLLEDLRVLAEVGGADEVDAFAVGVAGRTSRIFGLRLGVEVDDPGQSVAHRVPHARRHVRSGTDSVADVHLRGGERVDAWSGGATVRPWVDAFLAWDEAQVAIEGTLRELPTDVACSFALRPVRSGAGRTPLLVQPEGRTCLGFGVFPVAPRADAWGLMRSVERVDAILRTGQGQRYVSGWTNFDAEGWRGHFGRVWDRLIDLKRRLDPQNILRPGVLDGPGLLDGEVA